MQRGVCTDAPSCFNEPVERVANKARGFEEARRWDLEQYRRMTPDERRAVAKTLRDKVYGRNRPDVREAERKK